MIKFGCFLLVISYSAMHLIFDLDFMIMHFYYLDSRWNNMKENIICFSIVKITLIFFFIFNVNQLNCYCIYNFKFNLFLMMIFFALLLLFFNFFFQESLKIQTFWILLVDYHFWICFCFFSILYFHLVMEIYFSAFSFFLLLNDSHFLMIKMKLKDHSPLKYWSIQFVMAYFLLVIHFCFLNI